MNNLPLKEGGWTPALRTMAVELMESLCSRPIAFLISRPTERGNVSFNVIRDKIEERKYKNLDEWASEVIAVIEKERSIRDDADMSAVCDELTNWFDKKYQLLNRLSMFQFKSIAAEAIGNLDLDSFEC